MLSLIKSGLPRGLELNANNSLTISVVHTYTTLSSFVARTEVLRFCVCPSFSHSYDLLLVFHNYKKSIKSSNFDYLD